MPIIGHRGARGEAPENTLAGFRHAMDGGIRQFEFDIRLNRDGDIMVFHDSCLQRSTGASGHMREWSRRDLSLLNTTPLSRFPRIETSIPTLEAVLEKMRGRVDHLQLEIKTDSSERHEALLRDLGPILDRTETRQVAVLTSFNVEILLAARRVLPDIPRGYICRHAPEMAIWTALWAGASYLAPHYSLIRPEVVRQAHDLGLRVSCWTVNSLRRARQLARHGVDSIITDYPVQFRRVLDWPRD